MAEFPALPLLTDRYLADTRHLSTLEHGAYLLLLMEAWRRSGCSLPDDDDLLARLSGLGPSEWQSIKPAVMAFWKLDNRSGEWRQKTLSSQRDRVAKLVQKRRDAAAKRWYEKKTPDANAYAQHVHSEPCKADATKTKTKSLKENGSASHSREHAAFDRWNDFAQQRDLPQAQHRTAERVAKLAKLLDSVGDDLDSVFAKIRDGPHLLGDNDRGWKVSLDWVLKPANLTKLMEGNYDRKGRPQTDRGVSAGGILDTIHRTADELRDRGVGRDDEGGGDGPGNTDKLF